MVYEEDAKTDNGTGISRNFNHGIKKEVSRRNKKTNNDLGSDDNVSDWGDVGDVIKIFAPKAVAFFVQKL